MNGRSMKAGMRGGTSGGKGRLGKDPGGRPVPGPVVMQDIPTGTGPKAYQMNQKMKPSDKGRVIPLPKQD